MNPTFLRLELRRLSRDRATLFFSAILPAFFYVIFGATPSYGDQPVGHGTVAMLIMVSMAAYGAVTATAGIGGRAAVETAQGWGRQLALTPMPDRVYVATKAAVALLVGLVPIALVYAIGAATGVHGDLGAWVLSALVVAVGSLLFALYGLVLGMAFRSESALSAVGGSIVLLSFLGNVFTPLSGTLLTIARFTPLYGYVSLARYPISDGASYDGSVGHEALWIPVLNVVVWLVIFGATALLLVRRGRARQ